MDHTKEGVKAVKVYVTTDYKGCEYITPGKPYELRDGHYITDDDGGVMFINMNRCVHINGGNWRYTNEGMQIEEGKYYLRADGGKEGPMVFDAFDDIYPWRTAGFTGWWSDGGVRQNPFKRDQANLIAEWTEEPAEETDTPKVWGEMTDDEKGALLLEWHEGRTREFYNAGEWEIDEEEAIDPNLAYRVRPEPKRETWELWMRRINHDECKEQRVGTIQTADGKPDCNSIKMEKVND